MIAKTKAIVLHQVKYAETSLVVTLYTQNFGRQSYLINGIRSAKKKQQANVFQPMFLLDTEVYHKSSRNLQRLKEVKLGMVHQSIPFDIYKSTICIFISEVLYKLLRSEECDPNLFDFIWQSVEYFDSLEKGTANFHIWFLLKMTVYMGFRINNNYTEKYRWFNPSSACFVVNPPSDVDSETFNVSKHLANFIDMDLKNISQYSISGEIRNKLLEIIIVYYSIHVDFMGSINSLRIMHELFSQ